MELVKEDQLEKVLLSTLEMTSYWENSWITKEEGGRQKVYAKDAAGNPIDYTNGTKLLIDGRDIEQSINNVGALSAALTGLPTVPTDTTLACGFGTGTHGGDLLLLVVVLLRLMKHYQLTTQHP